MFSPNGIRAIVFDLDGTLRHNRPTFHQATCDFARLHGIEISVQRQRTAHRWLHYYWAQSPELLTDSEKFGEGTDQFWQNHAQRYLLALGCQPEQAASVALFLFRYIKKEYQFEDWVPPEVSETLQALKAAGYLLAVASNRTDPYDQQLERLDLQKFFQFSLAAGVLKSWKPDAGIFRQAMQQLGTLPEQTLYVGDNLYADVYGAQNANITPVLVDPERIFPEANCAVIHNLGELPEILSKQTP